MSSPSIALQLYTVRDETARDFRATIREVARIGYTGVEFAGYGGLTASEMVDLLNETGLKVAGTHVSLSTLETRLDDEINYCQAIGCSYLVVPSFPKEWYNAQQFHILAPQLNEIGRRCHDQGVTLAFHNHYHEFLPAEGHYLLDILLTETEAAFVQLELDTYWAAYAGIDPIAYLKQYSGRIPLIHLKDMTPDRTFTEVGDGTLDIEGFRQTAQEVGTQWFIVENDAPTLPSLESARRSFANLQKP
jgi:sugar phosphate isomerase/epimerase